MHGIGSVRFLRALQGTWQLSNKGHELPDHSGFLPTPWGSQAPEDTLAFNHKLCTLLFSHIHTAARLPLASDGQVLVAHSIFWRERPREDGSTGLKVVSGNSGKKILESWVLDYVLEGEVWATDKNNPWTLRHLPWHEESQNLAFPTWCQNGGCGLKTVFTSKVLKLDEYDTVPHKYYPKTLFQVRFFVGLVFFNYHEE